MLAYGLALLGRAAQQWRGRAWLRAYAHGLWNLFDLTPEGRPDWGEPISYP